MTNPSDYRPDVDGLRAVAVLSVIVFHLDKSLLPGGFAGVDVFFAISGYLISLHIYGEIGTDRFSLAEFYRRRIKRIAPAMLVVVAFTLVVSQSILVPVDAKKVAESSAWSILSLANFYFLLRQDTGYFAASSAELPLLHLWSLGVEEQFYLVWPLALMLFFRRLSGRLLVWCMGGGALLSFVAAEYYAKDLPSATYYLLPFRTGELLLGALAGLVVHLGWSRNLRPFARQWLALVGATLVLGSLFGLSEEQVFPGVRASLPTLGCAMLLLAGAHGETVVNRWMSHRPLTFVGRISYSAYLWHWPLIAFYRYGHQEVTLPAGCALFVATLVLARLSYRYVEQPCRMSTLSSWQVFLRQFAMPGFVLCGLAVLAFKSDGYGLRRFDSTFLERERAIADLMRPAYDYDYVCQRQNVSARDVADPRCIVGSSREGPVQALLWGDSNAAHYVGTLGEIARTAEVRVRNVAVGACPPLLGGVSRYVDSRRAKDCEQSQSLIVPLIADHPVIVLAGLWSLYHARDPRFVSDLERTVDDLRARGKRVLLLAQVPGVEGFDRLCLRKALSYPMLRCEETRVAVPVAVSMVNARIAAFATADGKVRWLDTAKYLCPAGTCATHDARGEPRYFDRAHLNMRGSWELGRIIVADPEARAVGDFLAGEGGPRGRGNASARAP